MKRFRQIAYINGQLSINTKWRPGGSSPINRLAVITVTCLAVTAALALVPANGIFRAAGDLLSRISARTSGNGHLVPTDNNKIGTSNNRYASAITPPNVTFQQKIVFTSGRAGNDEIYVMNADGSNPTNLTNNPSYDLDPDWSPDGTKIAFSSDRDGDQDIYVMNSDGSSPVNLTDHVITYNDLDPSWSPDGSKIAFVSTRDGDEEIYVMNADGSNQTRLTSSASVDSEPAWSPDGTRIAFTSSRDGSAEIYVMDADGSNPVRLTNNSVTDALPAWSPDGTRIAFARASGGGSNSQIFVMNADGTNQFAVSGGFDVAPEWSSDGSRIAFARLFGPGDYEILVMNLDGTNLTNLTNDPGFDMSPSWSGPAGSGPDTDGDGVPDNRDNCPTVPNPEGIVFHSNRTGDRDIYVMNLDGTGTYPIAVEPGSDDMEPWVSPDASKIVFLSNRTGDFEIFVMNSDGSNPVNLTNSPSSMELDPSMSPEGTKIAFLSNRSGSNDIWLMDSDGANPINLTNTPDALDSDAWFSPDGSKIAFRTDRDGDAEIYVMNADGSNPVNLSNSPSSFEELPAFSPDGSKIAFVSDRDGDNEIFVMDSDGGNQVQLTFNDDGERHPSFSPDGMFIYFVSDRDGDNDIYRMDLDGGNVVQLTDAPGSDFAPNRGIQLDIDGDGIGDACDTSAPTLVMTLTPAAASVPVGDPVTWTASVSDGSDEGARVVFRANSNVPRVQFVDPGVANSPLSVTVSGNDVIVSLATNATGALSSTAAHVAAATNANPAASTLVVAGTWPGSTGTGIVQPRPLTALSTIYVAVGTEASLPCFTSVPGWCSQTYTSSVPATHSIVAFLDLDGNGTPDASEPSDGGTATWFDPSPPDTTAPTISIVSPVDGSTFTKNQAVAASFSCMDEAGGSGLASCVGTVAGGALINTATVGSHLFTVTATDNAGNSATVTTTYRVVYSFSGFLQPVEGPPTLNVVTAGGSVSVKFSLNGSQGLAILAAGYPKSSPIACTASEPGVVVEDTVSAGNSSLSYNAGTDQYSYTWKTEKSWKNTCRMFILRLNDNTEHLAKFRFR